MTKKVIISKGYEYLSEYLQNIPENFNLLGSILDDRRNITRVDTSADTQLVIKSFQRIYLPNRIRYSTYYPSKAQRAFDNAIRLLQSGINTPQPIAYIEVKRYGLINQSFFISLYTDFQALDKVEESMLTPELMKELARLTFNIHRCNIFHVDYTLGNILFKQVDDKFEFSLIDNNRMNFGRVTIKSGIKNLVRLALPDEQLAVVAAEYLRLRTEDEKLAFKYLLSYRKLVMFLNQLRASLKKTLSPR